MLAVILLELCAYISENSVSCHAWFHGCPNLVPGSLGQEADVPVTT